MNKNHWSPSREVNTETVNIKNWTTHQILAYSSDELLKIHHAISESLWSCERAVDGIVRHVKNGGRVVTIGAGGSGVAGMSVMRELPQNHEALSPGNFTYRVAGGRSIFDPLGCEEWEDSLEEGRREIDALSINDKDVLIFISATGRTPYTRAAALRAREGGALTIGIVCHESELLTEVDIPIFLDVGPEIFMGATCEMSATAQKHTLDAIMNAVVIKLNVTNGNICRARLVHEKARTRHHFFGNHTQEP